MAEHFRDRPVEPWGATVARTIAFAITLVLVLAVEGGDFWGPSALPALGVIGVGLVADALIGWLGGLRWGHLALSVNASVLVWFGVIGGLTWFESGLFATDLATTLPGFGSAVFPAAVAVVVAFAAVVLLPRTQAIWAWVVATALASTALIALSDAIAYSMPQAYLRVASVVLAALAIGVPAAYVRSARAKHLGWRHVAGRLALLAVAVGFSVGVSVLAVFLVGQMWATQQPQDALAARLRYTWGVARTLSAAYAASEMTSATPELTARLIRASAEGDVGLAIYDRERGRVVIAVRRRAFAAPAPSSAGPATVGDDTQVRAFGRVAVDAGERAAIAAAANLGGTSAPPPALGSISPIAKPLGYADGVVHSDVATDAAGALTYPVASAPSLDGTRLALVASEPDAAWRSAGTLSADQIGLQIGAQLAPWLFLAFMVPCMLGLLALDRRDAARATLAATEERSRLNRDAHDRVYNRLTALANRLAATQPAHAPKPSPADEIRRTVADLQSILGDGGVAKPVTAADAPAALLADVATDAARIWGLDVSLVGADALHGIDPRTGWELQCIAEEALTNAGRHGHAARAAVTVSREADALTLTIADDRSGIAAKLADDGLPAGATGMRGMADRARALGGSLAVATGTDGTTVTATIPLLATRA